ncbi:glycosyltransferase family 2 protein [Bifidobacterium xylocopae]|nr:glycosyltransferase family 2 protein [Bifidobacterium xylocopae]
MTLPSSTSTDVHQVLSDVLAARHRSNGQEVEPSVAALVSVESDLAYLQATLNAVFTQRLLPGLVIIADCSGRTKEPLYAEFALEQPADGSLPPDRVSIEVVRAHGAKSYGDAIRRALGYAHIPQTVRALWLLHDDSRPLDPHCLEALVGTWRDTPTASLLGAKQLDWRGEGLHNVGLYAVRGGVNSLVVDGEPDQEQYDGRRDVFAVSLAGALLPLQTVSAMSGLGSWASTFGLSMDFSRRVCLSGGRVVIVPGARIGHRRARFEGVRSKGGEGGLEDTPRDSSMQVIDARETYLYSGHSPLAWPFIWIIRLFAALWFAGARLTAKQPYAAACELCSPWRVLAHSGHLLSARRHLSRVSRTSMGHLETLQASRPQIRQWRARSKAYEAQLAHPLMSNLARAHLRRQLRIRLCWAMGMVLSVLAFTAWTAWPVIKGLFSGGQLSSEYLPGTAAGLGQLARSATVPWTWGLGLGVPAAPTPFLLLLLPVALLTGGRLSVAVGLLFFLCLPLAALSFWALAGIFTRSNPIRALAGLLWAALAFALPIYADGDLPLLVVLAFLPAAFAFTFRAVGMYLTEQPERPHPSVRSAACAALCFTCVVLAEPQLLLALVVVFVLFTVLVVGHRTMLVLIPVPAALAMAPTLVKAVAGLRQGGWRQLFGDITLASPSRFGGPHASSLFKLITRLLGLDLSGGPSSWLSANDWGGLGLCAAVVIVVIIALVSLCLPSIARVSRLMWFLAIVGAALCLVSSRVAVAQDWSGTAAGSPLPGLLLAFLGLLACVSMVAGGAVRPFDTAVATRQVRHPADHAPVQATEFSESRPVPAGGQVAVGASPDGGAADGKAQGSRWSMGRMARICLTLVLLAVLAGTGASGLAAGHRSRLVADRSGLPMVAVDYLNRSPAHRILVLAPVSDRQVGFASMRTGRGDLIDSSAAARALPLNGQERRADHELASAAAALLSNADSDAIASIGRLGFGGVFVPAERGEGNGQGLDSTVEELTANITGSDGTQQVVTGPTGTYFRLTVSDPDHQGIPLEGERSAADLWWRPVWLWSLALVLTAYCLVALPRWSFMERSAA